MNNLEPAATATLLVPEIEAKEKDKVRIQTLDIRVDICDILATTTLNMVICNELHRDLEADFVFPLGEDQVVAGFGLDIFGKMREAVAVEKVKARQIFEEIVRENIDPGLVEKQVGNVYRTRIYPLPAQGQRQISLTLEQTLTPSPQGYLYRMPLHFEAAVDKFSIEIHAHSTDYAPISTEAGHWQFHFSEQTRLHHTRLERSDYTPSQPISILLPKTADRCDVHVGKGPEAGGSALYWNISHDPTRPEIMRTMPTHLSLYWDVSISRRNADLTAELLLLDHWLQEIENLQVDVVTFGHEIYSETTFHVHHGDTKALIQYLETQDYDGGTQYGALDFSQAKGREILLFTDGFGTFGDTDPTPGQVPVYIINSAPQAHHAWLRRLSDAHAGRFIDLSTTDPDDALFDLIEQPFGLLDWEIEAGDVRDIYRGNAFGTGSEVRLSGRLHSETARLLLKFGSAGEVAYTRSVELNAATTITPGPQVARIWARNCLQNLQALQEGADEAILDLGKRYTLVTDHTSLLVLERIEDYVRHDIQPPAELRDAFLKQKLTQRKDAKKDREKQLKRVRKMYQNFADWYKKDFPKDPPPPKSKPKMAKRSQEHAPDDLRMLRAEAPAASPARMDFMAEERERGITIDAMPEMAIATGVRGGGGGENFKSSDADSDGPAASIHIKKWDPQADYLDKIRAAAPEDQYTTYLLLLPEHAGSPSFFLDCADHFFQSGQRDLGLRILSNIAELRLESERLFRVMGHKLLAESEPKAAMRAFESVRRIKPEEPQTWRDLAQAAAANGQFQEAVGHFYHVVENKWDDRFPRIEMIALHEMNALIASCGVDLDLSAIDEQLLQHFPMDLRVTLDWDADQCDMDLWVHDCYGEKCDYTNKVTRIGGWLAEDFTQGYGPEIYHLKEAPKGKYQVQVNYFADHQQSLAGATTLYLRFFTHFGRPNQKVETVVLRMKTSGEVLEIGEFEIGFINLKKSFS
ncbi:MAG: VIT domain-containing protein, partial [Bacteroidota bacterium]